MPSFWSSAATLSIHIAVSILQLTWPRPYMNTRIRFFWINFICYYFSFSGLEYFDFTWSRNSLYVGHTVRWSISIGNRIMLFPMYIPPWLILYLPYEESVMRSTKSTITLWRGGAATNASLLLILLLEGEDRWYVGRRDLQYYILLWYSTLLTVARYVLNTAFSSSIHFLNVLHC